MKQITNKEYEVEKAKGHVLLPDTIRFICEANGYDASEPIWFRGVINYRTFVLFRT